MQMPPKSKKDLLGGISMQKEFNITMGTNYLVIFRWIIPGYLLRAELLKVF